MNLDTCGALLNLPLLLPVPVYYAGINTLPFEFINQTARRTQTIRAFNDDHSVFSTIVFPNFSVVIPHFDQALHFPARTIQNGKRTGYNAITSIAGG